MVQSFYFSLTLIVIFFCGVIVFMWSVVWWLIVTPSVFSRFLLVNKVVIFILIFLFFADTPLFWVIVPIYITLLFWVLEWGRVLFWLWFSCVYVFLLTSFVIIPWCLYLVSWLLYHTWVDFLLIGLYYLYILNFLDSHFRYPGRFYTKHETIKMLTRRQLVALILCEVPLNIALVSFFGFTLYACVVYDRVVHPREVLKHDRIAFNTIVYFVLFLVTLFLLLLDIARLVILLVGYSAETLGFLGESEEWKDLFEHYFYPSKFEVAPVPTVPTDDEFGGDVDDDDDYGEGIDYEDKDNTEKNKDNTENEATKEVTGSTITQWLGVFEFDSRDEDEINADNGEAGEDGGADGIDDDDDDDSDLDDDDSDMDDDDESDDDDDDSNGDE